MNTLKEKIKNEMFDKLMKIVYELRNINRDVARLNGQVGIPQEVLLREVKKVSDRIIDDWFI